MIIKLKGWYYVALIDGESVIVLRRVDKYNFRPIPNYRVIYGRVPLVDVELIKPNEMECELTPTKLYNLFGEGCRAYYQKTDEGIDYFLPKGGNFPYKLDRNGFITIPTGQIKADCEVK